MGAGGGVDDQHGRGSAPSSVRFPSCSLNRTALGRAWGAEGGCMWERSSASLRLASMSCSLERFGPAREETKKRKEKKKNDKRARKG